MVLHKSLERKKVISIGDNSGAVSQFKSPLPTPKYFPPEQTFSSKKDRKSLSDLKDSSVPPRLRLMGKSCPRVNYSHEFTDKARRVSFKEFDKSLSSKSYDANSGKLYIHQCFDIICRLGSGSFGEVFKVRSKEDGKYYAIKKSIEQFKGKADRVLKLREVQKHELLPVHPNCVLFCKAWEEEQHLYIQTELCKSSLSQYADRNHDIPESLVWNILFDILSAVKHLHEHNLIHLDVKPENIFIMENGVCKLGDFGLVLDLSKSEINDALEGDPKYLAPELMQGIFTKAADIFSVGITVLELACDLDLPSGDEIWHKVRNLEIPITFLNRISPELNQVIFQMMARNHKERPSAEKILSMEIMKKKNQERTIHWNSISQEESQNHTAEDSPWNFLDESAENKDDVFISDASSPSSPCSSLKRSGRFSHAMATPSNLTYRRQLFDLSASPVLSNNKRGYMESLNESPSWKNACIQLFPDTENGKRVIAGKERRNLFHDFEELSSSED